MARKQGEVSKSTRCRRLRDANKLGCSVEELPDKRGHHKRGMRGATAGPWNNQKMFSSQGYVRIRVGCHHPLADPNGYAYEHLLVWVSAGLGRPQKGWVLHHINEDKTDNRLENIELCSRSKHNKYHHT